MNLLPDPTAGKLGLLIGPRAEREVMFKITALLASHGPVRILDGGNSFDAFRVARLIRRRTPHLAQALERISIARAFTCYQVVTLFEQTPATPCPQLALDMLATFGDESVSVEESERLLQIVIATRWELLLVAVSNCTRSPTLICAAAAAVDASK